MGKINIVLGRSGAGKTRRMLEKIKEDKSERAHIIITTDQHTHEVEREMCQVCGDQISLRAEVLSFPRLCNHVFFHCGGLEEKELDGAGRMLLLYRAVTESKNHMSVLHHYSKHASFFEKLLKTIDELKTNEIPTELLFQVEATGSQKDKIGDIATICAFYDCFTKALSVDQREKLATALGTGGGNLPDVPVLFDPRDRITRMADKLRNSQWGQGKVFWVDGFADFTPQQQTVLRYLAVQGEEMTINLMGENRVRSDFPTENVEEYLFAPTLRSRERVEAMAKQENIPVFVEELENPHTFRVSSLAHLEKHLFSKQLEVYGEAVGQEINVLSANSTRSEVEWVAAEILELVQYGGHRYRDVVVVARDFAKYRHLISTIFPRYGIPVFTTEMTNILVKPVISVVCSVFDAIKFRYRYDAIFPYLKSGFSSLSPQNVDILEEYVLFWGIRGEQWKKPFTFHPSSYDGEFSEEDHALLETLNEYREIVINPLMNLENACKFVTAKEHCEALYTFIEEIELFGRIQKREEELEEAGDLLQKAEYEQLWDILIKCLEECYELSGSQPMELDEFADLFTLLLTQCKVGTIPVALDQVTAGESTRLKNRRAKTVFWLGADEATVPMPSQSGGLLHDLDRVVLEGMGISLNQREEELYYRETTTAYEICSLPSERFYISYPCQTMNGDRVNPCFVVEDILTCFPDCREIVEESLDGTFRIMAKAPALDYMIKYPFLGKLLETDQIWLPKIQVIRGSQRWERGQLTPLARSILYGEQVTVSATRLEQINACYYAHFLKYALRGKPRKVAEFNHLEYGNFIHWILQHILQVRQFQLDKLSDLEKKMLLQRVDSLVRTYLKGDKGAVLLKSAREAHIFNRLRQDVSFVVNESIEQLEASAFSFLASEKYFLLSEKELCKKERESGLDITFQGYIDRVDGCILEDQGQFFHPVDYKSGKKDFGIDDMYYGRDLQLPLYYLALEILGKELMEKIYPSPSDGDLPVKGAAFSYFFSKEVFVTVDSTASDAKIQSERKKELKREGMYLNHEDVIHALEPLDGKTFKYLPLSKTKGGIYSGKGLLMESNIELLMNHVREHLWNVSDILASGEIQANPYDGGGKTPCGFCDYKRVCFFERGQRGEHCRVQKPLSSEEILKDLRLKQDRLKKEQLQSQNAEVSTEKNNSAPVETTGTAQETMAGTGKKRVRFPRPSERRQKQEG